VKRLLILLLPLLLVLAGCGGGGGRKTVYATPTFSVDWPTRTRDMSAPSSGLSVTFQFENAAQTKTFATINSNRSSTLAAHTETYTASAQIATGDYTLLGTFYSQPNEGGIVVATVAAQVSLNSKGILLKPNGSPLGQVAFNGVVKSVVVGAGQTVTIGTPLQLVVSALDANSNVLALTPGSFSFSVTAGGSDLTVAPDGLATGVSPGTASVVAMVDGVTSPAASVAVVQPTATPSLLVDWPLRTRNFSGPSSALSVSFSIVNPSTNVLIAGIKANRSSNLAAHTETYTTSSPLPIGVYAIEGTFYAGANQSGIVVATVTVQVMVASGGVLEQPNGSALGEIAFDGVVKSVALAPNQTITIGKSVQVLATAFDAHGNELAISPGSFLFSVASGQSFISLTPDGIGTGNALGQPTVKATVDGISSPATSLTISEPSAVPSILVDWPLRTRNFSAPNSALSASFKFENSAQTQTFTTVNANRATNLAAHTETYASSTAIPQGDYTLIGNFYAQANQSGVVVATVSVPVQVATGGVLEKTNGSALGEVAFTGVIKSVVIAANQTVSVGSTQQLVVSALDGNSNVVAITPGSFDFSVVSGSSNLSVTPDGIATGVAVGSASVTATVDGITSAPATVSVPTPGRAIRFTNNTDSIQLTGGALGGACGPLSTPFTIEAIVRPTSAIGEIWQQWTNAFMDQRFGASNGDFQVCTFDSFWTASTGLPLNQWDHLAWCYDGTNYYLYQNGTLIYTHAAPSTGTTTAQACALGYNNSDLAAGSNLGFEGDLAGFRISNIDRYMGSSYTPPTLPLTSDGSTLMLINPYSSATTPTTFSVPGSQGLTATFGGGGGSATSPTWVAYTP